MHIRYGLYAQSLVGFTDKEDAAGTLAQSALTMSTLRGRDYQTGALYLEQQPAFRYNNVFSPEIACSPGSYVHSDAVATLPPLTRLLDAPGATYLAYTPNGKKLITAGVDNYCRVFTTGSDDEPITIDECQENNTAVVAGVREPAKCNWGHGANAQRRMASLSPAPRTAQ